MRLLLLAFALGLPAHADTVYLKNGNQMDGVITEQSKTQITLDIGYGSTILDRADIEKIVRAGKNQASKTAVKLNLPPEARVGTAQVKVAGSPASEQGFDGLLGMTFLGQFIVRVDAAHGRLILEDLK